MSEQHYAVCTEPVQNACCKLKATVECVRSAKRACSAHLIALGNIFQWLCSIRCCKQTLQKRCCFLKTAFRPGTLLLLLSGLQLQHNNSLMSAACQAGCIQV